MKRGLAIVGLPTFFITFGLAISHPYWGSLKKILVRDKALSDQDATSSSTFSYQLMQQ